MNEPKLFAVYLGGRADGCNIELHDVVFVVGNSIEETYPLLAKKWFGNMQHFHIDSYFHLKHVDGHEIELVKDATRADPSKKLYFINLGAYRPNEFIEHHQSAFYVTENGPDAVRRAKAELCQGMQTIHKDDVVLVDHMTAGLDFDADDVLHLDKVDEYYIALKPAPAAAPSLPVSAYIKLDMVAPR
ncbi:MAG: DUF1543 domain-containing protein [Candidatus Melainabacteria bacterium]|nr:DUF1543 domain-containing protein [Candidatus Melainabacteria bacterium]